MDWKEICGQGMAACTCLISLAAMPIEIIRIHRKKSAKGAFTPLMVFSIGATLFGCPYGYLEPRDLYFFYPELLGLIFCIIFICKSIRYSYLNRRKPYQPPE